MITAEYLTAFNNELLHCYKAFKQLCEENNLQYFACGGTCIGAVRHNNIIPWDDDIDVLMPRDDYYKFLDLKSKLQGTGYDIISYRDSDYYFPFSKFINTNTTIWESRKRNRIIGAFIDVFPLYTTDLPDEQIITMQKQFYQLYSNASRAIGTYSLHRFMDDIKRMDYMSFISHLRSLLLYRNGEKHMNAFEAFEKTMNVPNGAKAVSFTSNRYGFEKEIFKSEWFKDYILYPFGDTEMRVPVGYDELLRSVFGDYMQLPPIDKRIPDHRKYYVNLKEGLTMEEVKQRLKAGENCVY